MDPDSQAKLEQLFLQADEAHTGQIQAVQVQAILADMGHSDLYVGSIAKDIRRINFESPEKVTLNLTQMKQYVTSFESTSRRSLWKAKYDSKMYVQERKGVLLENSTNPAAPGAGVACSSERAHLSVVIGGKNIPNYSSQIIASLQKKQAKQGQGKPFLKLQIVCDSLEKAKKTEELFKDCYNNFLKIISDEEPDSKEELSKLHLNTAVLQCTVNAFITTTSDQMIELLGIYGEFIDSLFSKNFEGDIHFSYKSNFDVHNFVSNKTSTQFDLLGTDTRIDFNGVSSNVMQALRHFLLKDKAFTGFSPLNFIGIALIHLENVNMEIEFDKGDFAPIDLSVKHELICALQEGKQWLNKIKEANLRLIDLLELLDDNITLEGALGEWKAKISFKVKNFKELFLADHSQFLNSYSL